MRPGRLLALLLMLSTAGLVAGVAIERSTEGGHEDAPGAAAPAEEFSGEAGAAGEAAEGHGGEATGSAEHADSAGSAEHGKAAGSPEDEEADTLVGIDLESVPLVGLAAGFTLALAVGVWIRPAWGLLLTLVFAAMLAFAALDVREVVHQVNEHRAGLAALAAGVAALHLIAAALSRARRSAPDSAGAAPRSAHSSHA